MNRRQKLDKILKEGIDKSTQIRTIEEVLETQMLANHPKCNCIAHALNLCQSTTFYETASDYTTRTNDKNSYFASPDFLNFLLLKKVLIDIRPAFSNSLIIYFNEENYPVHAGIVKRHDFYKNTYIIESKWGRIGRFEHRIWDVPTSYGNCIRCYSAPSLKITEDYFKDFCHMTEANSKNKKNSSVQDYYS